MKENISYLNDVLGVRYVSAKRERAGKIPTGVLSSRPTLDGLVSPKPKADLSFDSLGALRTHIGDCSRCKLSGGRTQIVFGSGPVHADLMFVGEGPGEQEDLQGEPFIGRAGQLLTKMIEAMGLSREKVYIANVVKCRPPENRNPEPDEIESCSPFLKAQIELVNPKVIVGLGKFAVQTLLKSETRISELRGKWATYQGRKFMATYHPAYLLRNPSEKKSVWEDLQLVMKELGL